jgi:hypothetical protein
MFWDRNVGRGHSVKIDNTVEPRFTNASHHEQIGSRTNFLKEKSWVTNGISSNEHASRQQRLVTSWEYWRESVSCCVTFAQYTSLIELAVPSLEFHCVFLYILLSKTPWDQRRIMIAK